MQGGRAIAGPTRYFELEHIFHIDDEQWDRFGPGAVGIGRDMGIMSLALHLSSGRAVDPEESAASMDSPEGRRFLELSSERWCAAGIASGTPEADARAAAEHTLAAYTADPEEPEENADPTSHGAD